MKTGGSVFSSREMSDKQGITQISGNRKLCTDIHMMDSKEIGVKREERIHMPQNKNKVRDYEHGNTTWRHGVQSLC